MGQALRRAVVRVRNSPPAPSAAPAPPIKNSEPTVPVRGHDRVGAAVSDAEDITRKSDDSGVLEERDLSYDAMLRKMVGTITSKPGGKHEMGEAFIVEKYGRPLPKLRTPKAEAGGQKPLPPGTLTAAQVREIILLHQGKSSEYQGRMEIHCIARKFKLDAAQVQKIVQFVSLPPVDDSKNKEN